MVHNDMVLIYEKSLAEFRKALAGQKLVLV